MPDETSNRSLFRRQVSSDRLWTLHPAWTDGRLANNSLSIAKRHPLAILVLSSSRGCKLQRIEVANMEDVVVRDPNILGGVPVFRQTRVPFQSLLDYLEAGQTLDEFLADFPTVTRKAAVAGLEQAKTLLVAHLR
jgi:uncharacterized protein (DUF433 family)